MDTNVREQRKHNRIEFNADVRVHPVKQLETGTIWEVQPFSFPAKGSNLSEEGLQLELADTMDLSSILTVKFEVQNAKTVDTFAKLAWKKDGICGLQFIVMHTDARKQIRDYINQKNKDL